MSTQRRPRLPVPGEDILRWARDITEFIQQIVPRESVDMLPQMTKDGTGYVFRRKPTTPAPILNPWAVTPATPPDDADPDSGSAYVQVALNSFLMSSDASDAGSAPDADDVVTITGLGSPLEVKLDDSPRQIIYCDVDVTALFAGTGTVTGEINCNQTWDDDGSAIYPSYYLFNTDDGTPDGSGGDAPSNAQQTDLYIPLAYTYDITDNPWGDDFILPGIALTDTVNLVQLVTTHMRLIQDCYDSLQVYGPIPPPGGLPPGFNT